LAPASRPAHHVLLRVRAGQHDHGHALAVAPELGAELAAVAVRQADVEQDGVVAGVAGVELGGSLGRGFGLHDAELAGEHDLLGQRGAERRVVFDDQDGAGGRHVISRGSRFTSRRAAKEGRATFGEQNETKALSSASSR
jgi:hypothetical protein